jgi:hypothetical protein
VKNKRKSRKITKTSELEVKMEVIQANATSNPGEAELM